MLSGTHSGGVLHAHACTQSSALSRERETHISARAHSGAHARAHALRTFIGAALPPS
jgi:hypothetical protein